MDNSEVGNNTGRVIGAVLLGIVTGAALGLLFAPDKGNATRKRIVSGAINLADDLKNIVKEKADFMRRKTDEVEENVREKVRSAAGNHNM